MDKISICNKALTLVGAAPITSLTDPSENARVLNRVYELALRSILSESEWNFAVKRSLLALSTHTLAWYETGEQYVYVRPSDCIRIFSTNDRKAQWRVEGDYIISDTHGLGIRYVYFLDQPSKYTSSFITAFIDKLASDIAFVILNSEPKARGALTKYETISLPNAQSQNAQTGKQQVLEDDAWELAKYGSTRES